ncbi:helix-hairpin-helix domain-containing protein [Vreelandella jeotgali]|uniref:helix-hairpin-helix domain-containing protein n=1 Tax=Vreelandella jeotgali TaxID=553386 RepID=UPI00034B50FE|nr:helix-hairpin-helix domain-containing protein [Halomonas jeotgali]
MKNTSVALVTAFALMPTAALADAIIGSWNIQHLGWDNDKAMSQVAHIAQHVDLLAVQELMNPSALNELEQAVEAASGESWSSIASDDLGRSSYREHYGFLWRDSEIEYDRGAVVFLDSQDIFAREPYSAQFTALDSGQQLAVATVHVTYGDSISDRLPEIEALSDYWQWLAETYPGTPRLLMGDYNMPPTNEAWAALRKLDASPAITDGATTLGTTNGAWSNLYDNVWHSDRLDITNSGIIRFPDLLPGDHVEARDRISDHAPIWIALGDTSMELMTFDGDAYEAANDAVYCIDLNEASADQLTELHNVGPARARQIITLRPWDSVNELSRVNGLGAASVKTIENNGLVCP